MQTKRYLFCAAMILIALPVGISAHAQAVLTGTVTGTVQDASGAVLPGVELTLRDVTKGVILRATTQEAGMYRFPGVAIGDNYELRAELPGFRTATIRAIQVLTNFAHQFNIVLEVGDITQEVSVIAEAPLVDTTTSVSSETLAANIVKELPLYSRNKTEIATLMAGVTFSRSESPGAWYEFHVRGDATVAHGFRVDGATTITGHGRTALSVAQNAVERFEFIPGGFQAEYGEQTSGMVNVITKTGTNEVHGAYDSYFRPEKLASGVESGIAGQVNSKQPGNTAFHEFSLGGPFVRDKLWYHYAVQYWQDDRGNLLQPIVLLSDLLNIHTKFTYQQNTKSRWDLSIEVDPFWQKNTVLQANSAPESQRYQDVTIYIPNLQFTHTISPQTVVQGQVYLHHLGQTSGGLQARNGGTVDASNLRPFVTEVTRAGSFTTGYPNTRGQWSEYRLRTSEKVTTYRGNHGIKLGMDYAYLWGARWSNIYGGSFNDRRPVAGVVTRSDTLEPASTYHWGAHDMAAYVQDSWKVVPNVTLDFGLRWDYQSEVGHQAIAPRLGVSVDPSGRGTSRIYGNVGVFYQNLWAFSWASDQISLGSELYRIDNPREFFPHDPNKRLLIGTDVLLNRFLNQIGDHYVNPYNLSWTVGYETRLPWSMKVDTSYSEVRQHNWLYTLRTATHNILQSDNCGNTPLIPKCGLYRGLEVTLRKPFSNRVELLQTYTRSKVEGFGNLFSSTFTEAQLDGAYSVQDWDEPHVFRTTGMYELPYDVLIAGVFRWASGRPYSIDNAQVGTAVRFVDREGRPSFRNAQRLKPQSSLDFTFSKSFRVGGREDRKLKLEMQVLNATNRINVLRVQSNFAAAGAPTQVDFARQLQIGAGISW
ncbi:MAG: TonB-dependent receptor [Acidobacteria bacterium]|nr:TonB-dependent receptor [Acidobacteriota bacterium]